MEKIDAAIGSVLGVLTHEPACPAHMQPTATAVFYIAASLCPVPLARCPDRRLPADRHPLPHRRRRAPARPPLLCPRRHPLLPAGKPATLATNREPVAGIRPSPRPLRRTKLAASPYTALLNRTAPLRSSLQNHASSIVRQGGGKVPDRGSCPSRRPMETGMFRALADLGRTSGKATPVAIAITGAWLATHREELAWLQEQERQGLLAITWVNHSLTHRYDPAAPLARNFLPHPRH